MSKGYDQKKIPPGSEKKGVIVQNKKILDKKFDNCINCNNNEIEYWDETDEEAIFQCKKCKSFITIPFRKNKIRFYFTS